MSFYLLMFLVFLLYKRIKKQQHFCYVMEETHCDGEDCYVTECDTYNCLVFSSQNTLISYHCIFFFDLLYIFYFIIYERSEVNI